MARILVVDDDEGVRSFMADALQDAGHRVQQAADAQAALRTLERRGFPLVITDLKMPGLDGLGLLAAIRAAHPDTEVIVVTAHGSVDAAVQAMKAGAFDFVQKPLSGPDELEQVAARALERHRLRALREAAHTASIPPLSYGAPVMSRVVDALRKVARTEATVLLQGPSGTGKEVAARSVHAWSPRADGPFVAVNCAALSEQLLESELFGHERGAFTGALARRRGRIELAAGGSFFLDEVGELRPALQSKLLRVLQERQFERVGGNTRIDAEVRWIAATNRDLGEMVRAGRFREDLYYRLAVFPVALPPLRERGPDLAPLARSLLARVAANLGRPTLRLLPSAHEAIAAQGWPGNIRELANALERAAILTETDEIGGELLAPVGGSSAPAPAMDPLPSLVQAERELIARTLAHCGGNRKQAAEHLGIGLRTLYDKLKRYELS